MLRYKIEALLKMSTSFLITAHSFIVLAGLKVNANLLGASNSCAVTLFETLHFGRKQIVKGELFDLLYRNEKNHRK